MLHRTRLYQETCPATVLRLYPATLRGTARCPATAWWGLKAFAVWQARYMTGPSIQPPRLLLAQQRRENQWGMTQCGSSMSGSRGRPSPGKVWLSHQVHIYKYHGFLFWSCINGTYAFSILVCFFFLILFLVVPIRLVRKNTWHRWAAADHDSNHLSERMWLWGCETALLIIPCCLKQYFTFLNKMYVI